jgi:hypothetical protein
MSSEGPNAKETVMSTVEFVNREKAEAEAARAIGLLKASDESKVEAWFALQAVADLVGEASNTGIRGIHWTLGRRAGRSAPEPMYGLAAACVEGHVSTSMRAPATLEEACKPEALARATALFDRKILELGGRKADSSRSRGTGAALLAAVGATSEGERWIAARTSAPKILLLMVGVAAGYGRDGVCHWASLHAHKAFLEFDDRVALVREFPLSRAAFAKALSLRTGADMIPRPKRWISDTMITKVALRSGVTQAESRVILRALIDGRSKTKLVRAVNEAARMLEAGDGRSSGSQPRTLQAA